MKILVFAAFYLPFKGGFSQSLHELLKRLAVKGEKITVLTCNTENASAREVIEGVEVIRLPSWNPKQLNNTFPIPKPFSVFSIIRELYKRSFDVVSTQTRFFPTSLLGFLFAKMKRIPLVHTERGGTHTESQNLLVAEAGKMIDHTIGFLIARFSRAVIGVSDAACVFMKHLGAKNPIRIPNGVDVEFWQKPRSNVKGPAFASAAAKAMVSYAPKLQRRSADEEASAGKQKSIVITFVGRLIYGKGVQDLLKAIAQLSNVSAKGGSASGGNGQMSTVNVNIIGDGQYRTQLEQLTKELGLKQVRFLGEMAKEQIRDMLWQTDIFVNPSYSEGLPRSVLEAAAVGLPIIATDVGGTREIIVSEKHGFLVQLKNIEELASKIEILFNNVQMREEMGRNVREYVRMNFDWDKITEEYVEVFNELLVKG